MFSYENKHKTMYIRLEFQSSRFPEPKILQVADNAWMLYLEGYQSRSHVKQHWWSKAQSHILLSFWWVGQTKANYKADANLAQHNWEMSWNPRPTQNPGMVNRALNRFGVNNLHVLTHTIVNKNYRNKLN